MSRALEQQSATAEILRVLTSSPGDLDRVLATVAEKAGRLTGAAGAAFWALEGDSLVGHITAAMRDYLHARADMMPTVIMLDDLHWADSASLDLLLGVADLVELSRAVSGNIRQNVAFALGLKAALLVTTLTGLTGLWPAILSDTGATVLVTANALRLLRFRPRA